MTEGLYEGLINKLVALRINEIDREKFYIQQVLIDKSEASNLLASYISKVLHRALSSIIGDKAIERQIDIANKIILLVKEEINKSDFEDDLIETEGRILRAIFSKIDSGIGDFDHFVKEITPTTRLIHSELFTGGNSDISMESELRKEIKSSDRIDFLVSFIKYRGIVTLMKELIDFTSKGGKLRIITTTYMGASESKAIEFLSNLPNTEVKVSYNTSNERLHAKAYLFYRNTGFHTGYIGSSNMSASALTKGLEWNLKITTNEISHIIDKFQKTFESYWQSNEFETFDSTRDRKKLITALKSVGQSNNFNIAFFDIIPYPFQKEILEKLEVERTVHRNMKNLVVAATGTGKTVISAFDYKAFAAKNPSANLLFIAHRKEILQQAQVTYRGILKDNNFGELWVDGIEPTQFHHVFASIQTLNNKLSISSLSKTYYDFIVIDEAHHSSALSYREIFSYFSPKIFLGLTATPERSDGSDITLDFCNRIAAEIRLPEAMNKKLLCPFQYFGISDRIDLSSVKWSKGKYVQSELSNIYTSNDQRVGDIIQKLNEYLNDIHDVRALGFCVTQEHAQYMAEKFTLAGIKADYLISNRSDDRQELRNKLKNKEINYLFVVDIFNEGVDIPEVDTVLFLRPTESLTVFLQQLGRGLRLSAGKESLSVLDFVGNARDEYNFESKFRALIGKTNTTVEKEIKHDFPHLPLGCSIVLEKIAKEIILNNIHKATNVNKKQLVQKIQQFEHQHTTSLTLNNFTRILNIPLQVIYNKGGWKRLCASAKKIDDFELPYEEEIISVISNKWLSTSSLSYFSFLLRIAKQHFQISLSELTEVEQKMCLMLHYDIWQKEMGFSSLEESIREIGKNEVLTLEIIELLEILIDKIDFIELDTKLSFEQPLKIHARYTRDQILVAFGLSTFSNKSSNREGVAENKALNVEVLFIDLIKSKEDFSPTTLYDDYAINETLFHWQSQNQTRADSGKGLTYINHRKTRKTILLFVREKAKDEYKNTMGYVFAGPANLKDYYGSKPMNIRWELEEAMPGYLWKDAAKMAVG